MGDNTDGDPTASANAVTPTKATASEPTGNLTLLNMGWTQGNDVIPRFIPPDQRHFVIPSLFEQAYAYANQEPDAETRDLRCTFIQRKEEDEKERKARRWRRPVRSPKDPDRKLAAQLNEYLDASKEHLKELLAYEANKPPPCTLTGGCNCNHMRPACRRTYGPPVYNNSAESSQGET